MKQRKKETRINPITKKPEWRFESDEMWMAK
jgi:hypothetical protein